MKTIRLLVTFVLFMQLDGVRTSAQTTPHWTTTHWARLRWNGANDIRVAEDTALASDTALGAVLRLTPARPSMRGGAFTTLPIPVTHFSTRFIFRMGEPGSGPLGGADGLVFVIKAHPDQLGLWGDSMGYGATATSVAIEFYSYYNGAPDLAATHLGLRLNGREHLVTNVVATPEPLDDGKLRLRAVSSGWRRWDRMLG